MKKSIKHKAGVSGWIFFLTSFACYSQNTGIIQTVRTTPKGLVTFSQSSILTGVGNSKHVDGYVKKYGTTSFIFPVGDNGVYRPFAAAADGTNGAYFQENPGVTTLPDGNSFPVGEKDATLSTISTKEFWDINGSNSTKLTLTWNAFSDITVLTGSNLSKLTITGWNTSTSRWEKIASTVDVTAISGGASSLTSGSITTDLGFIPNSFSVYSLAEISGAALPVTLISFSASASDAHTVVLDWTTTVETNSQQFNIEQSIDGKLWNTKGIVKAKGESSQITAYHFIDTTPNTGPNLYRLKMIDMDETFAHSRILSINLSGGIETVIYPNPVSSVLYVQTKDLSQIKELNFYNLSGELIHKSQTVSASGIDMKGIKTGIYLVKITLLNGNIESRRIIITN